MMDSSDSEAMRREVERKVQASLQQLNENDRDLIQMRYVKQLSIQEVASALNIGEIAASMRCLRAEQRLQALLSS